MRAPGRSSGSASAAICWPWRQYGPGVCSLERLSGTLAFTSRPMPRRPPTRPSWGSLPAAGGFFHGLPGRRIPQLLRPGQAQSRHRGKWLWLRTISSTLVGQLADSGLLSPSPLQGRTAERFGPPDCDPVAFQMRLRSRGHAADLRGGRLPQALGKGRSLRPRHELQPAGDPVMQHRSRQRHLRAEYMSESNDRIRNALAKGLRKGLSGYIWLLKILLPFRWPPRLSTTAAGCTSWASC